MTTGRRLAARWGRLAHVVLACALALPLHVAVLIVVLSARSSAGVIDRWSLALIVVAFIAAIVAVALQPGVRPVQVAAARTLLGVDLPAVRDPSSWRSRGRGLTWLLVLVTVGTVASFGVLWLLPLGVGLVTYPFSGLESFTLPGGGPVVPAGAGWRAWWTGLAGLGCLVACAGVFLLGGRALAAWAPTVIGPSLTERVAAAAHREADLARANRLAREVHDSVGHTLTAMTVQVSAARALLLRDVDAADRALAEVEDLGRRAQADIDSVVGALRCAAAERVGDASSPLNGSVERWAGGGAGREQVDALCELVQSIAAYPEATLDVQGDLVLDVDLVHDLCRVTQEAVTNAARHGAGPPSVLVRRDHDRLVVVARNPVAQDGGDTRRSGGGHGLLGLRERLALRGGNVGAGLDEEGLWTLRVVVPVAE